MTKKNVLKTLKNTINFNPMPQLHVKLIDSSNGSKINSVVDRISFNEYIDKRGFGKNGGTVVFNLDRTIDINAIDSKGHLITGTAVELK